MGQQRSIDIADVFQVELSPVPPALIDEYGCLRKGDKAMLLKSISVYVMTPSAPDVVQVDGGQLLYHVVWSVLGTTGDVAASFGIRLTLTLLSPRSSQRKGPRADKKRKSQGSSANTKHSLPCREPILHNSKNMNLLNSILCSYPHSTRQQAGLCCYP